MSVCEQLINIKQSCCVQTEWVFIQEVKEKKGRNQHPI